MRQSLAQSFIIYTSASGTISIGAGCISDNEKPKDITKLISDTCGRGHSVIHHFIGDFV